MDPNVTHLALRTRGSLSHQLLLAGSLASTLREFTHVFPVPLSLLLLGVDAAGVERRCGRQGRLANGRDHEALIFVI